MTSKTGSKTWHKLRVVMTMATRIVLALVLAALREKQPI